ncbi:MULTISPECIES: hypothetical protein [unclassified Fibrobacter]|uniref:hypothetical protein n=1 Tax=unclassified Fibrobacter TaxID=2634177 RepID=UPI000D6C7943|nr:MULTISPECIES: hypothetical protein [unclassified Fibrobacter]PWJ68493.1 hypothetical protein BGX12_10719 [Fibrobacter sp. UWR4]PZW72115.1 hypothetical protein C8E88_100887 [Fibrobacter sp. UWR1]
MPFKISKSALLAGLLLPTAGMAYFTQNDAGREVFSFMNTFDGPRNTALEKAAGALFTSDPTIALVNPASLIMPEGKNHMAEAHWQTGDFADNQGSLSYTGHYQKYILQLGYNWLDYGTIEGYDDYGDATGKDYNPFSQLITATIAFPMKHFSFGATIKFATDNLADDEGARTAMGAAFDWGITWQSESKLFGLALAARDFGCLLRDYVDDDENQYYPMSQTFIFSGYMRARAIPRLTLFAAAEFPRFAEPFLNLAGEYNLGKSFFVRLGFSRTWLDLYRDALELMASENRPDETNRAHMLSAGLGYIHPLFSVDYSFSYLAQGLGQEHRLGIRFNF